MKKRLIFVAVAALIPATVLLAYNEYTSRAAIKAQVNAKALEENRQAASEIERLIEGAKGLLAATAAIPDVQRAAADPAACKDALAPLLPAVPWIRNLFVLDLSGTLICEPTGVPLGPSFADRPYFQEAVRRNAFHIGEYTQSRLTDVAVLPLALPLRNKEGRTIAILTSGIRLDWLNDRIRERGLGERGALTIADRNGVIIARNPQPERFVGTRIPDSFQRLVNGPAEGVMDVISQDGTPRVIAYSPTTRPPGGLYISVGISKADAYADVNRQTFIAALSIALGSIIALGAAWLAGGLIRRPVNRIVSVIKAWQAGTGSARTALRAKEGDVEMVGEALDRMLDELERRSLEIKRAEGQRDLLMRELAHRVKNTLTLVQAIAHQTFRGKDPQLTRSFAERLIALAGAYDVLLGQEFAGGDIRAVVAAALKPHLPRKDTVVVSGEPHMLAPNIALSLSMVVHELATNATKYGALSADHGVVLVSWSVDRGRVTLHWHERGGPPVAVPTTEGFGSKLVRRAFGPDAEASVEIKYLLSGVRCELAFNAGHAADRGEAVISAAS